MRWRRSRVSSKAEPAGKQRRISPSYTGCHPASVLASRIKQGNRKYGTKAELALRAALWRRGLRYRLNDKRLPGTPDIVFPRHRVVVFVDGDFWHGRDWENRRRKLVAGNNPNYWVDKIAYNRERDERNNQRLVELGWTVRRLWETEVLKDAEAAASTLADLLRSGRLLGSVRE